MSEKEDDKKGNVTDSAVDWISYGQETLRQTRWRLEKRYRRANGRTAPLDEASAHVGDGDPEMTAIWDDWLRRLSDTERQVLMSTVVHGFTETETAQHMCESVSRVHRIKMRALVKLREMIADGDQDHE